MKNTLIGATLLLASSSAFAGIIIETASFGTQNSVMDQSIGSILEQTITINGFDTAFGNLTGVNIAVFSQIDSAGKSTNTSGLDGESEFRFSLDSEWNVSSSIGSYVFADKGALFSATETNHKNGTIFDYGQVTDYQEGTIVTSDLSAFLNDVDFTFNIDAFSAFTNLANGGSAIFENVIDSGAWGKVEVTYTYDKSPVTSVSEPSSLAILALGLVGFAASRKKKA